MTNNQFMLIVAACLIVAIVIVGSLEVPH